MSIRIVKGNIFKVKLNDESIRFFQFIGKDQSELNGDVIAIFKKHYTNESITPEMVVDDSFDCFMHTSVLAGVKLGLWERVFSSPVRIIEKDVLFRSSLDYGLYPGQHFISHRWVIWSMNDQRHYVGTLPKDYYNVSLGGIYAPKHVISRLETGKEPALFYPDYC